MYQSADYKNNMKRGHRAPQGVSERFHPCVPYIFFASNFER